MVLIGMLFLVGCILPQITIGKAILNIEMYQWGLNELDNTEMLFDYWIYNYGDTEAKNISVECKLLDENYNVLKTAIDNYGSLASYSVRFGEMSTEKPDNIVKDVTMITTICYVDSCDNCEILYKRIPDLVEDYEK